MRSIRRSQTYVREFTSLLTQGLTKFGAAVVIEKANLVDRFVEDYLAHYPKAGRLDQGLGIWIHRVSRTPFMIAYDFDDLELRLHMIFHAHADRASLHTDDVEW